jgi:hypothetical protein
MRRPRSVVEVGPARFRPIVDSGVVPTAYGGEDATVALSESVPRAEDFPGPSPVLFAATRARYATAQLPCDQDLTLVQLNGTGLPRLRLSRSRVIDTDRSASADAAALARQLQDHGPSAQGLLWTSREVGSRRRRDPVGRRMARARFHVVEGPYPLDHGHGLTLLRTVAEDCGVLLQT